MLSTVNAAETLFRHETATRAHELAILRSIEDRKEAVAASTNVRASARPAWPRPIALKLQAPAAAAPA
jgi:hypothetical protein